MATQLKKLEKAKYPQGSVWRRWDPQVHTPESHLHNNFGDDWDAYVKALFNAAIEKDIAAIGITDYFTIDGYKKLKHDYLEDDKKLASLFSSEEIAAIHRILIVPNIEFRLRPVGSHRINFHVIFSDEVSTDLIEEHFLHDLEFTYEGEPQKTAKTKKLKLSNIKALGKKLRSDHAKFKAEGGDLYIGMKNAVVDEQQIASLLDDERDRFLGKYLIGVVADEDLSKIDWDSQDHQTRKVLIQMSDFLIASNSKSRAWALGHKSVYKEGAEKFVDEFQSLKPCIHGSDAHAEWELFNPCTKRSDQTHSCKTESTDCAPRYCWIKADPTFEGLKQIIFEPDARVQIGGTSPAPIKSNYSMARYQIDETEVNEELTIKETNILMNPDLVAVIGGRGRGKTAFVDLLAHNFSDQQNTDNNNSFVRRLGNNADKLQTILKFLNDDEFSKELADGSFYSDGAITYIAQGDLERYLGDDLDDYVHDLVFGRISDTVLNFEFETLESELELIEENIERVIVRSANLVEATRPQKLEKLNREKQLAQARLKDIATKIKVFEKKHNEAQLKATRAKQEKIANLKERRDLLKEALELTRTCQRFLNDDLPDFNTTLKVLRKKLDGLSINHDLPALKYEGTTALERKGGELHKVLGDVVKEIEQCQQAIRAAKDETAKHAKLLDQHSEEKKNIKRLEQLIEQFAKNKQDLAAAVEKRQRLLAEMIEKVLDLKRKYDEIVSDFSKDKDEVLADISFEAEIRYNLDRILRGVDELLDRRSVTVLPTDSGESEFAQLLKHARNLEEWSPPSDPASLTDAYVEEISRLVTEFATKVRKAEGIEVVDFYRVMYRRYFSVTPSIKYRNTDLHSLSLGQKATVLIKIYLAQGEESIIIDSHDDHLDNEFIMEELVQAVRKAKDYRQVILVSNNGNLVVNSDAEQVVIAERDESGSIFYRSGALENPIIRDRALEVLEGGRLAFQKREQKYRIEKRNAR